MIGPNLLHELAPGIILPLARNQEAGQEACHETACRCRHFGHLDADLDQRRLQAKAMAARLMQQRR